MLIGKKRMNISPYAFPGIALNNFSVKMESIINFVSDYTGISRDDILSKERKRYIAQARFICWLMISEKYTDITLKMIGKYFGGFHHTTVMFGKQAIKDSIQTDSEVRSLCDRIRKKLEIPDCKLSEIEEICHQ